MKTLAIAFFATALAAGSHDPLPVPPRTDPAAPAIARGADYFGFPERFNRYYTDPSWRPSRVVYAGPDGSGDGATRETPMAAAAAIAAAGPGTQIIFERGNYEACYELSAETGGTYDDPVVLYGERNDDGSPGVAIRCCGDKRKTCINLEAANYVAIDGFELIGGSYGARAVGTGYAASEHSRGNAILNCKAHDQERDPFLSGHSDWDVWERNVAYGAKEGDGHGIYLSNGGDWNIVRFNETYSNVSSDFQINADPHSTCEADGIAFDDPQCDAYAGTGEGGRGASDYFLVDGNYFHHSDGPGANVTSVRRSVFRNNVFGPSARHGVSFWQETDNPALGSSDNKIVNNLFVTTNDRQGVQFINSSSRNEFANNIILGMSVGGDAVAANPSATLMEVDDTVGANSYHNNLYVGGVLEGRSANADEMSRPDFASSWFAALPLDRAAAVMGFVPAAIAPFLTTGLTSPYAPTDRTGKVRSERSALGPFEAP